MRPGVQALLFQVLRSLGRAEALRRKLVSRAPPPAADALLCAALALSWQPEVAPYEPFTLVNQAVEAAKRSVATRAQASFVNACLRRFLRERDALVAATDADPVARWNHPLWWVKKLQKDHPTHWEQILQANNAHAPMILRVNASKGTVAQYQQALAAMNVDSSSVGEHGLILQQPLPVTELPGFAQGMVSVQDAAAQLAAPLLLQGLDLTQPLRVLDACAAPGGKTAHLLEYAGPSSAMQVTALEVDSVRSARIHETLHRIGLHAQVLVADAARPQDWWQQHCAGVPFDAILLDAPCTASGIVRRTPMCAGCAAKPTLRSWRSSRRACLGHCGRWCGRAGGCCIAPVRCSAQKAMRRYKRFLRTTPMPGCCPRRGIYSQAMTPITELSRTMQRVSTTDFFTHCCKKPLGERRMARWVLLWAMAWLWLLAWPVNVQAQSPANEVVDLGLEQADDGLYLNAALQLALPALAEDALYKGIPVFFVAEAQVLRERWYWSDRQVAAATRHMRLSYQPLTRRWRLSTSPVPFSNTGLGVVLGQNFDDLRDALSSMQRISRWKIADGEAIDADVVHTVNFRFRLDLSQLPRPLQIGAVGSAGWSLMVTRNQRLVPEVAR